jgi:hypothetical protein
LKISKFRLVATLIFATCLSWSAPLAFSLLQSPSDSAISSAPISFGDSVETLAPAESPLVRIAHAGGLLDGQSYTNSLEALSTNRDHFDFFEIDFEMTSDGALVCIHDWHGSAERILGQSFDDPPSLAVFRELAEQNSDFTPCDLPSLEAWIVENPEKRIITDIKADNLKGLTLISQSQGLARAVIPQVHSLDDIELVRRLGFSDIILTLYSWPEISHEFLLDERLQDLFAVTFPRVHVIDLGPKLRNHLRGPTLILAHPIFDVESARNVQKFGIQGIYTTLKDLNYR